MNRAERREHRELRARQRQEAAAAQQREWEQASRARELARALAGSEDVGYRVIGEGLRKVAIDAELGSREWDVYGRYVEASKGRQRIDAIVDDLNQILNSDAFSRTINKQQYRDSSDASLARLLPQLETVFSSVVARRNAVVHSSGVGGGLV